MLYGELAELYGRLSATSKRLEKISILAEFLKDLKEKDRDVLYLLMGDIYPESDARNMGINSQLAMKAISKSTGVPVEKVTREWKSLGDLGKVAEKLTSEKKQSVLESSPLKTEKVIESLRRLPELEGKGTVEKKLSLVSEILASASPAEALYVTRTLMGDLRVGIRESTIRESMARAFFQDDAKEASAEIQGAMDKSSDVADVFERARKGDLKEIKEIPMKVGRPIKAMLSQKAESISDGFNALGRPCAIEYKYDGFRLIIHKEKNGRITAFTRRLEDVTRQFPEVVEHVKERVRGDSFILDSEAVGYDRKTGEYTPFQNVSRRIKRKHGIEKLKEELPVEINVFDVLYHDGKSLLDEPFRKRTALIKEMVDDRAREIIRSKQIVTGDEKEAEEFCRQSLKDNQEGVMMKNLDAVYQPGSRAGHMLKVKPEEHDFDLVITGAEYGTGKRSGWMSSFIISCRKDSEFFEVGKVGTGIKEKSEEGVSFGELTEKLTPLIEREEGKSVLVRPEVVVAVTYQEIQKSPNYGSGFALRFPRFTALRPDKPPSEIATLKEVGAEFRNQKKGRRRP